jgi:hypothetical protein
MRFAGACIRGVYLQGDRMGAGMSSRNTVNIGQEFRARDCYVLSEIHYLDSATDYRVPQNVHAGIRSDDPFLLDSSRRSCRHPCFWWYFLVVFLILGSALLCIDLPSFLQLN